MSIQEPMTVMGIPGKIEILRPEDKLVVRVPNLDQKMANEIDASFTERLGKHRAVVLPDLAEVDVIPPGAKVVVRVPGLTEQIVDALTPVLSGVFGEDGFIIISADMIEVEVEPRVDG